MRLAILSDIHEDLNRLKKVLDVIGRKGSDMSICLGDISGFSDSFYRYKSKRNAPACLDLVREKCDIIIPGNHDLHAAGMIPDPPAENPHAHWQHEEDLDPGYSKEQIQFLSALPKYAVLPTGNYKILLSHYMEPNLNGYIKGFYNNGNEFRSHFRRMQELDCKLGFTGHAHARGFYLARPESLRHFGYRRLHLKDFPVIIGIPPVTRHKYRTGFCIFDTDKHLLKVFKLY